jgi:hypothetical protein
VQYNFRINIKRNYIHDEIKSGLNSGKVWYGSFQNLLSSRPLSGNLDFKTYTIII